MGGINHQPCNRPGTRYLAISTMMSKELCAGRAAFEQANMALEDVILRELAGKTSVEPYNQCISYLDTASKHLAGAVTKTIELEQEMQVKGYTPLPAFAHYHTLEALDQIGDDLARGGFLRKDAFDQIAAPQIEDGFYGALRLLRETIKDTQNGVVHLGSDMEAAAGLAENGLVADELETNGPFSFRGRFMQAYALFGTAYDRFLASAVFSTELWFQSTGVGSLLDEHRVEQAAVA